MPLQNTVDANEILSVALSTDEAQATALPADTRGWSSIVHPGVVCHFAPRGVMHIAIGQLERGGDKDLVPQAVAALSREDARVEWWHCGVAGVWARCTSATAATALAAACGVPCYEVGKLIRSYLFVPNNIVSTSACGGTRPKRNACSYR